MKKSSHYEVERPACMVEFLLIAIPLLVMAYGAMQGLHYIMWGFVL